MSVLLAHGEPFTIDDLFALPENGMRQELLDGVLLMSPNPSIRHQMVTDSLIGVLLAASHGTGWRPLLGIGIVIPSGYLIPDLSVARREVLVQDPEGHQLMPNQVVLAVEVESPHGRRRDRVWKPQAYAEAGIPRYWRVVPDGESGPEIIVHDLVDGVYREVVTLRSGQPQQVEAPFPVTIDPATLLD